MQASYWLGVSSLSVASCPSRCWIAGDAGIARPLLSAGLWRSQHWQTYRHVTIEANYMAVEALLIGDVECSCFGSRPRQEFWKGADGATLVSKMECATTNRVMTLLSASVIAWLTAHGHGEGYSSGD
jgi:hypothetical protein